MPDLPVFKSRFLNHISRRLAARRRALKYHGKLTWTTQQPDEFEWLSVNFDPTVGNYCIFQFVEGNRAHVFVRSKKRSDRGRILVAIEEMDIIDNEGATVDAIEATIVASALVRAGDSREAESTIRAAWSRLMVRVANDLD